jgi:hypothetical protein
MEHLEQTAIATAPIAVKPTLWKRYVDDILEKIHKNQVQNLTDHLNQADNTGSIKFTAEPEKDGKIPFLDTLITRRPDGSVKLMVYRKPTHTDQYLHFSSHHPIHQKLGVVRTLLDRCNTIVTEEEDKVVEEQYIRSAFKKCGYPAWAFEKVKHQMMTSKEEKKQKRKEKSDKNKGLVTVPYVRGMSEAISRVFKKHNISTAMRPHTTIRRLVVHPKDKRDIDNSAGLVYKIPCKGCDKSYIGETSRMFSIRKKEHKEEAEEASQRPFTRGNKKISEKQYNKSAITDHVTQTNHIMDWEQSKIMCKEENCYRRGIRESIHILRERGNTIN